MTKQFGLKKKSRVTADSGSADDFLFLRAE
jgi:hypothetical protein